MISYAQNFEDVILWRILKDIKNGFYIDVGANDPVESSVTKWFYEQGWHGINIEPVQAYYQKLCQDRPRDVNLCLGAGASAGVLTYYEIPSTGLSTLDENIAKGHKDSGFEVFEKTITVKTLTEICAKYVEGDIHFLKIDVEGAEETVIRGMDFKKFRPWVLCIEATLPNTQILDDGWEKLLLAHNYEFIFFDGLSKYYIANEQKELLNPLGNKILPANVFDSFKLYGQVQAEQNAENIYKNLQEQIKNSNNLKNTLDNTLLKNELFVAELKKQIDSLTFDNSKKDKLIEQLQAQFNDKIKEFTSREESLKTEFEDKIKGFNLREESLKKELLAQRALAESVINSHSWRLTKPFRVIASILKKIF